RGCSIRTRARTVNKVVTFRANKNRPPPFPPVSLAGCPVAHDEAEMNWVRRAQAGDADAFASLVERYWTQIYRWLYALNRELHTAERLPQETFLKAWANLRQFTAGTRFRAWLFQIARNSHIDRRRSHRPDRRRPLPEHLPAADAEPGAALQDRETQVLVRKAIDDLPPAFRPPSLPPTPAGLTYTAIPPT